MSVHFSIDELFQAIEKNDIVALENAIFFLGANIHVVRICENLTPMSYAARLGHFEQVKILLADMKRYEDEDSKFALLQIGEIIYHAIPNRHKDMDFLLGLLDILAAFPRGDYLDVGHMFEERAFDFLEEILEKNSKTYIPIIVEYFTVDETHVYNRELFRLSDKIRSHPLMVKGLSNFREKDPLYYAVMANDAEEIRRLLPDFFRNPKRFPRCRIFSSVPWKPEPHFPSRMEGYWELMKLVIEKDDVSLFNVLMNGNKAEILRVTERTQEQLFFNIFMDSLHCSSINIINHVLSLGKPSQEYIRENNWRSEYFYEKLHGNVISANAMKDFCELGIADKAEITGNICLFLKEWLRLERVNKDTLLETFDEIEDFIRETPDHAEMLDQFSSAVRDVPKISGRIDLVGPLTKYGVQYSRTDVIVQMNEDIDFDRFNEPNNAFLGENRNRISVPSINCLSKFENPLTLLWESVVQSGIDGRVTLYAMSMFDTLQHERVKHKTRRIKTTNEHVASVPSLQKQCRLTIREAIHTSNPVRPTDAMLSLFVNKYLPKTLVNYLLFRDEDVHRPLHYLLVNLEDSDDPESEVDCSDSSEEYYYDPDEMNEMY